MDDKKRELYERICKHVRNPDEMDAVISEAGYVLLPTDDPWYLYREGQRNQRAKDAAKVRKHIVVNLQHRSDLTLSINNVVESIAQAIESETDAE